ncbi:tRNA glutamyl-Q(34) synthetase GluQRS [Teredinibacter haidensis]|uniref:tRNA glutamyl-Q(34) synthetase GluQRS n=1 Tax=Teredinibacter haidensis TaxID=2731755 RepID=UPI000948A569|nr:tRNA glutamyl-Q(34) synthetase GluQRS [Teredinibacter haidensis]
MLTPNAPQANNYVGRFAPSPSGPLHQGSLVCALASYLDARANNGTWLVRMEDIDPPREQPGADKLILDCLEAHGLHSDKPVLYQSQRSQAYHDILDTLAKRGLCYPCNCTRARLKVLGGYYDGHCLQHAPSREQPAAMRINLQRALHHLKEYQRETLDSFIDNVLGQHNDPLHENDDFVIHRKDGLFAYQLAVVADDIAQGVTHIVRGADLLNTTVKQRLLFYILDATPPQYGHIPIITDTSGNKLSKQNHAHPVDPVQASQNLATACRLLGLANHKDEQQLARASLTETLHWAQNQWQLNKISRHPVMASPQ